MLKAIFYLIQLSLLVWLAVWLADISGVINIDLMEYSIELPVGVGAAILIFILIISMIIYRVWLAIISIPRNYGKYRKEKNLTCGYEAISMGLAAIAAGDTKNALSYTKRAKEMIPDSGKGLVLLLEAQAKKLQGNNDDVVMIYEELATRKDMALLGVRGLVNNAMKCGDFSKALELAENSYKANKKQVWLLKQIYLLQIYLGKWNDALKSLKKAVKAKAIDGKKVLSDEMALRILLADRDINDGYIDDAIVHLKKALKIDAGFVPAAVRLVKIYIERGRRKAAVNVIEKAWRICPHPELVPLWDSLFKGKNDDISVARLKWFEKLISNNKESQESEITLAKIAIEEELWGAAKSALKRAEKIRASARLYKLWAELEEKSFKDMEKANSYLEKASNAEPDKVWICSETGKIYPKWEAVAMPHGSFNTIVWDFPNNIHACAVIDSDAASDIFLLQ